MVKLFASITGVTVVLKNAADVCVGNRDIAAGCRAFYFANFFVGACSEGLAQAIPGAHIANALDSWRSFL